MVEPIVVFSFVVALVFTTVIPVAITVILAVRKKISIIPFMVGAMAFFISQMLIRIPLLSALSALDPVQSFATQFFLAYVIILCFSAGLFEESARLTGAIILKKHRSYKDVISFGLGHGFCEVVWLIGMAHINNIICTLAINYPGGLFSGLIPPEMLEQVAEVMLNVNPVHIYLGLLERLSAVVIHIFATVLVFKGVIHKKYIYYILAIIVHTLANLVAVLLNEYVNLYVSEAALLLIAIAMGVYILNSKKSFKEPAA